MCFVRSIPGRAHLFLLSDHFHNYNVLKGGMIMEDVSTIVFGVWFLVGAALVFWMQAGFAMVEAGFTRAKNAGNIIMKNLMDFCLGTVSFMILGSSLLLGSSDWENHHGICSFTLKTMTGQASYSTLCSVQQQQPSCQELWQREQSSLHIVYTQLSSHC